MNATVLIEILGIVAVTIMVFSYALEHRNPRFVLLFACGCTLAAIYALLLKSFPFLFAEAIWAIVAFKRWLKLKKT